MADILTMVSTMADILMMVGTMVRTMADILTMVGTMVSTTVTTVTSPPRKVWPLLAINALMPGINAGLPSTNCGAFS